MRGEPRRLHGASRRVGAHDRVSAGFERRPERRPLFFPGASGPRPDTRRGPRPRSSVPITAILYPSRPLSELSLIRVIPYPTCPLSESSLIRVAHPAAIAAATARPLGPRPPARAAAPSRRVRVPHPSPLSESICRVPYPSPLSLAGGGRPRPIGPQGREGSRTRGPTRTLALNLR